MCIRDSHGHVSEPYKHALLERAALHLLPSRKEGWGIAVIEAAQHGVPTVAYASAGGVADSIRDGVTGRLVRPGEEFGNVVGETLGRREAMAPAAREWAARFSWEATGRKFERITKAVWSS